VVAILRDPGTRSWSHYRHLLRKGDIQPGTTLENAVVKHPEILDLSGYGTLLAPWQRTFGTRLKALLYEDLSRDPSEFALSLGAALSLKVDSSQAPQGTVNAAKEPRSYFLSKLAARSSYALHAVGLHRVVDVAKAGGVARVFEREWSARDTQPPVGVNEYVWDAVGDDAWKGAVAMGLDPSIWNDPRRV
ncbi:MAG: hypothetical protein WBG57_04240, partial [Ornithinimicrobium sp.]